MFRGKGRRQKAEGRSPSGVWTLTARTLGKGRRQKAEGRSPSGVWTLTARTSAFCFLLSALFLLGCRQKMAVQPRYDPLEPSDFFADHMSARPRIPGTVARGEVAVVGFLATGKIAPGDA